MHLDELTAGAGAGGVRAVLLGGGDLGQCRAGGLRGGERVPGRAGRAAAGPGPGRDVGGVGAVGGCGAGRRGRRGGGCSRRGLRAMDPGRALAALGQVLARGETVPVVADVDWAQFAPVFTAARPSPLICRPARGRGRRWPGRPRPGADPAAGGLARRAGRAAARPSRQELLVDLVRAQAAAVLGHASAGGGRPGPAVPGPGLRLADRGGAAEPAGRGDRAAAARHPGLRLPHPGGRWPAFCGSELLGRPAGSRRPRSAALAVAAGEPMAIVGMGCRFPGGVQATGGPVGAAGRRDRRDLGVPGRPGLGPGRPV